MKGLKTLTAVLLGVALLATAAPRIREERRAYKHYVGCGVSQQS